MVTTLPVVPETRIRSPGGGHGYPLQYLCQRSLVGCSPRVSKESETAEQLTPLLLEVLMGIASRMDCLKIVDGQQ